MTISKFVTSGSCQEGEPLPLITSIADLYDNVDKLECLFTTGCASHTFATGNHPGEMITAINIPETSEIINKAYNGEFTFPYRCAAGEGIIGTTIIAGQVAATGLYEQKLGSDIDLNIAPGQGLLNPDVLYTTMDFTINPNDLCPLSETDKGNYSLTPFESSPAPGAGYVSIGTNVGVSANGNSIMLVKAFGYGYNGAKFDPTTDFTDREWSNVLFYAFENVEDLGTFDPFASNCTFQQSGVTFDYEYTPFVDINITGFQAFERFFTLRKANAGAKYENKNLKGHKVSKLIEKEDKVYGGLLSLISKLTSL